MFAILRLFLLAALTVAVGGVEARQDAPVRFGVLSIAPPSRIHINWQPFTEYVSDRLGHPVNIVVPRGFGKMKQAVADGAVDFFYVNSYVFYRLKQAGHATAIAQMENIDGGVTSRSEIFVRTDSGIDSIAQLRGRRVAFVSPAGAGGYLAPSAWLAGKGLATGKDIVPVFTKNLSNSIHQVLLGDIDAATMCGVNYRLMSRKVDTGELKIIGVSDPYPENVIAARAGMDAALLARFRQIVLAMPGDARGREVLARMKNMKIRRFVPYDDEMEDMTRALLRKSGLE